MGVSAEKMNIFFLTDPTSNEFRMKNPPPMFSTIKKSKSENVCILSFPSAKFKIPACWDD